MATITKQESIHINKFNTNQSLISPGNYNVLSVNVPGGMNLRNCEIALSELNVYNSIYNISAALGNNQFTIVYYNTTTTAAGYVFTIPDGLYGITDLNAWLQTTLIANGLYLTISSVPTTFISITYNPVILKVQVTADPITGGTPPSLTAAPTFGAFTGAVYVASGRVPAVFFGGCTDIAPRPASGTQPVNVVNPTFGLAPIVGALTSGITSTLLIPAIAVLTNAWVWPAFTTVRTLPNLPQDTPYNTVLLTCNLVNSTLMPQYNRVIYDYAPSLVAAGTQLSFAPYPDFFDCQDGFYNNITITFVDENEAPVPINDPTMSVTLLLRPKQISEQPEETDLGSRKRLGAELIAPPDEDNVRIEQTPSVFGRPFKRTRFGRS